jgi:hypothetical protein
VQSTEAAAASAIPADSRVALLEAENAALRARLEAIGTNADTVVELNDERVLQDVGIYRYHHPLENAVAYRARLDGVGARIAELVKAGVAIEKSNMFTFDGSLSKGRSFTNDLARLMLRAYNAEAENVVRTLRVGNLQTAIRRFAGFTCSDRKTWQDDGDADQRRMSRAPGRRSAGNPDRPSRNRLSAVQGE